MIRIRHRHWAAFVPAAVIFSATLYARQPPAPPAAGPTGFTASPALEFRAQEIAADFGVGYAVVIPTTS